MVLPPLRLGLGQGGEKVKGQHLHQLYLGTFPFAASLEVLPVHHQDLPQVRPKVASLTREDLAEGLLELLRVQAVEEGGEGGVAWGFAQAQVRQEVGVGAGKSGYASQGVHAAQKSHQNEGQKPPEGIPLVGGPRVGHLG